MFSFSLKGRTSSILRQNSTHKATPRLNIAAILTQKSTHYIRAEQASRSPPRTHCSAVMMPPVANTALNLAGRACNAYWATSRAVKHSTTHPHRKSGIINRPNLDEFVFFKLTCNNFLAEKQAQIKSNDEADQSRPPTASEHCRDPDDFGI